MQCKCIAYFLLFNIKVLEELGCALVEQEGQNRVDACLYGVEADDEAEKVDYRFSWHAHKVGGYKKVCRYHNDYHCRDAEGQRNSSGLFALVFTVYEG